MKATVPEIAWHNKNPVFAVDIQREVSNGFYRAATGGGDFHIVIWRLFLKEEGNESVVSVEFAADLDRHIKAVNVVRFSNDSKLLASGDDDAVIIIWSLKEDPNNSSNCFSNEDSNKECWTSVKVLRGHKDDIYDICWSPTSKELISGSVDNTAMLWNVSKGQQISKIGEHNGFVQGVAWDPKGKYFATLCSDRALRLFDADTKKNVAKVTKAKVAKSSVQEGDDDNFKRLFHDDTVKTFFRRLCFSPDGHLIFAPCGIYQDNDSDNKPPKDVTYIFLKTKPERPIFHLPSRDEYTVAVRCCPVLFELNPIGSNLFTLPYRIVYAIASRKSVVLYDTQQFHPLAIVSDIHYATLTDISWSPDGRILLASSSDGYCTIINFNKNELGVPYSGTSSKASDSKVVNESLEDLGVEPLDRSNQSLNESGIENQKLDNSKELEEVSIIKPLIETNENNDASSMKAPVRTSDQNVELLDQFKQNLNENQHGDSKDLEEVSIIKTSIEMNENIDTSGVITLDTADMSMEVVETNVNESGTDSLENQNPEEVTIIKTSIEMSENIGTDSTAAPDDTSEQSLEPMDQSNQNLNEPETENQKPDNSKASEEVSITNTPIETNENVDPNVMETHDHTSDQIMEVDVPCNETEKTEQENSTV